MKLDFSKLVNSLLITAIVAASSSIVLSYQTEVKVDNNEKMIERIYEEQKVMQSDIKEVLRRLK